MGKKRRSHDEQVVETHGQDKRVKVSHGENDSSSSNSKQPILISASTSQNGHTKTVKDRSTPGADIEQEAREWLAAGMAHLRRLGDQPGLAQACVSVVGEEDIKLASQLQHSLRSKRSAFEVPDLGLHSLGAPSDKTGRTDVRTIPPLPEIRDPALVKRAFRHRSVLTDAEILSGDMNLDYDRLEFAGDAYLQMLSTRLLWERMPNGDSGKLSSLRSQLVCNATLAQFSLRYGFDERIEIVTRTHGQTANSKEGWQKILGDVFEAYVGALIHSRPADGFAVAERWLHALWTPRLPDSKGLEVRKSAKTELAVKLMSKGAKLTYEETKKPVPDGKGRERFTMGAFLTGWGWEHVRLGEAWGHSKGDAGQRAADAALVNPVTSQAALVKRKFDALCKAEHEREGGPRPEVLRKLDEEWK